MASVFKFFREEVKCASSISSTSGNSTSTEEEGTCSLKYVEGHKNADKGKKKILTNSDRKNIAGKRSNLKDESKKGSHGTSKNRTKSENKDSVG